MDDRLLASGGRVQGLALRTEADFFAQLRASPSAARRTRRTSRRSMMPSSLVPPSSLLGPPARSK